MASSMMRRMTYGYATAVPMLIATKTHPGKYAPRSAQIRRPMRATWPTPLTDCVERSVIVGPRPRREARRDQPSADCRLQALELGALLDRLVPSIVPVPRERAVVEI